MAFVNVLSGLGETLAASGKTAIKNTFNPPKANANVSEAIVATTQQIFDAQQSFFRYQTSFNIGVLKFNKGLSKNFAELNEKVEYIKERLAPKIIEAKEKGASQLVSYDPLAPEGEKFRKVDNKTGKVLATRVSKNFMKSALMGAANLSQRQGLQQLTPSPLTTPLTKPVESDEERFERLEKISYEESESPLAMFKEETNKNFEKVFEMLQRVEENQSSGIGNLVDTLAGIASAVGVGLAGGIGYLVGSYLNDKLGLSEKFNSLLEKVGINDDESGEKAKEQTSAAADKNAAALKSVGSNVQIQKTDSGYKYTRDGKQIFLKDMTDKELQALSKSGTDVAKKGATEELTRRGSSAGAGTAPAPAPTGGSTGGGAPLSEPTAPPTGMGTPQARPGTGAAGTGIGATGAGAPTISGDDDIKNMIKQHEGLRLFPYKDSVGLWTVGYGHLIGDGKTLPPEWNREFSQAEVDQLFEHDYAHHRKAAEKIPGFDKLGKAGQGALTDLTFNMGPTWWKKWPRFTAAMEAGDIEGAARSLENSRWYGQVKSRAPKIVGLLRSEMSAPGAPAPMPAAPDTDQRGEMLASGGEAAPAPAAAPTATSAAPAATVAATPAPAPTPVTPAPTAVAAGTQMAATPTVINNVVAAPAQQAAATPPPPPRPLPEVDIEKVDYSVKASFNRDRWALT